jgi:protein TonB
MLTSSRLGATLFSALALAFMSWQAAAAPLLNGVAVHTELGKEQFIAGLYSDTVSQDAQSLLTADVNKRIQVRVLADQLSSRRFKRMWIEGIAINSSQADLQENAQNMADFSNMLRVKLVKDDILTIDRSMNEGLTISLNGTSLGSIEDRRFFDLLLRTWIGGVPLSSSFRENLLQAGDIDGSLLARFESTRPSDERIATVERAIASSNKEKAEQQAATKPDIVAMEKPSKDLIEAPKLDKPELAMAPPALGPEKPKVTPPPAQAAQQPEAKPEPKQEAPKETQIAKATPAKPKQPAPADNDVLEDDDEESFTAASLLSRQLYIGKVKSWAQRELKYPDRALRRSWEGNVRLDITLDRKGKLLKVDVAEEAEYSVLTKEALRAVKEAEPFPAMPEEVGGDTFLFSLPVAFKLQ